MSSSDLMLDVSQAVELKLAFRRNGWNNAEIKTLSEGGILADVLKVIKGQAEVKIIEHLIDCDSAPYIPPGWTVEEHKKGGLFKFDLKKISLYLSEKQKKENIDTYTLREDLADKPVLNANVLDYLLAHPELIPKEWKKLKVFFWGTTYFNLDGNFCVRCLGWYNNKWDRSYCLFGGLNFLNPAALAA